MAAKKKNRKDIICRCNNVDRATIEKAIREGCTTLNQIFDTTSAGVGPCGGSCRRKLKPLLDGYLATGSFPTELIEDRSDTNCETPNAETLDVSKKVTSSDS